MGAFRNLKVLSSLYFEVEANREKFQNTKSSHVGFIASYSGAAHALFGQIYVRFRARQLSSVLKVAKFGQLLKIKRIKPAAKLHLDRFEVGVSCFAAQETNEESSIGGHENTCLYDTALQKVSPWLTVPGQGNTETSFATFRQEKKTFISCQHAVHAQRMHSLYLAPLCCGVL